MARGHCNCTSSIRSPTATLVGDRIEISLMLINLILNAMADTPTARRRSCRTPKSAPSIETLCEEAKAKGWIVISMKHDWKRLFTFEP
jgi:hypothetical protein